MTEQLYIKTLIEALQTKYKLVKIEEHEWRYTFHFGDVDYLAFCNVSKSTIKDCINNNKLPLTIKRLIK
jgi:hypothetical protein